MMNRDGFIKAKGFEDITDRVIDTLKGMTTKQAENILERIANSNYYRIYDNCEVVIVDSQWILTQEEMAVIGRIEHEEVMQVGKYMDSKGLWKEWLKAK